MLSRNDDLANKVENKQHFCIKVVEAVIGISFDIYKLFARIEVYNTAFLPLKGFCSNYEHFIIFAGLQRLLWEVSEATSKTFKNSQDSRWNKQYLKRSDRQEQGVTKQH